MRPFVFRHTLVLGLGERGAAGTERRTVSSGLMSGQLGHTLRATKSAAILALLLVLRGLDCRRLTSRNKVLRGTARYGGKGSWAVG